MYEDCEDGSDESLCEHFRTEESDSINVIPPPAIINLDGQGRFTMEPLAPNSTCPETHFKCHDAYCLPVYLRCNGVKDCLSGEDEVSCEDVVCEGYCYSINVKNKE